MWVCAAILSSNFNIPLNKGVCFAAEIGLSGELRPVPKIDQRINEAEKLGFKTLIISSQSKINIKPQNIKVVEFPTIEAVLKILFKEQD